MVKINPGEEVLVQGYYNLFGGMAIKIGIFRIAVLHEVHDEDLGEDYFKVKWYSKRKVFPSEVISNQVRFNSRNISY